MNLTGRTSLPGRLFSGVHWIPSIRESPRLKLGARPLWPFHPGTRTHTKFRMTIQSEVSHEDGTFNKRSPDIYAEHIQIVFLIKKQIKCLSCNNRSTLLADFKIISITAIRISKTNHAPCHNLNNILQIVSPPDDSIHNVKPLISYISLKFSLP